jgi:hypothetical protein
MSVFSPKTNTTRIVPIFPRVRPYLDKLFFEPTEKPADLVFPGLDSAANLRTMFRKIIMQSGQEAWPRLFQNLRASGATDIANMVRSHTAAAWCGHSEVIALQHYRQVIEEDFVKVTEEPAGTGPAGVAQNPARMGTVLGGMGPGEKPQYPCFPESCGPMPLLNTCSPNLDGSESPRTDSRASPSQPD